MRKSKFQNDTWDKHENKKWDEDVERRDTKKIYAKKKNKNVRWDVETKEKILMNFSNLW